MVYTDYACKWIAEIYPFSLELEHPLCIQGGSRNQGLKDEQKGKKFSL